MHNKETASFSKRISIFSFILTIAVIWIHAVEPAQTGSAFASFGRIYCAAEGLLGNSLGQLAVPGFFYISGYLFFRNCSGFREWGEAAGFFKDKLLKRVSSLLLPYLIWNIIYFIIYAAAGRAELSLTAFAAAALSNTCNPVFWYLHELIIINIMTPMIYVVLRQKKAVPFVLAAFFAAAVFYDSFSLHIVNEDALFYYMCGAALSLHYRKYEENVMLTKHFGAVCCVIFIICEEISMRQAADIRILLTGIIGGRIAGLLALYAAVSAAVMNIDALPDNAAENAAGSGLPVYMRYNFLIYALHYLEIRAVRYISDRLVMIGTGKSISEIWQLHLLMYILMPLICVALTVMIGEIMNRVMPKVYRLVTGGRN